MKAVCLSCGQEWPRDPRREVPCPQCYAAVGSPCKRPSGHGCSIHIPREQAAVDAGFLSRECPGRPKAQGSLF